MELFNRVLIESFNLTKKNLVWLGFALCQGVAVVLFSTSVRFFFTGKISAWVLFLVANLLVSISVAFFWPKIKNEYELLKLKLPAENRSDIRDNLLLWVRCFLLSLAFSLLLLVFRFLFLPWVYAIFISSLVTTFLFGIFLFAIVFRTNFKSSFQGSLDLWIKKTQFPVLISFGLMLGNGLAFAVAKGIILGVRRGGFSEIVAFAKIWSLALIVTGGILFLISWFNCLVVIGFMEITKTNKSNYKLEAVEGTLEPKLID